MRNSVMCLMIVALFAVSASAETMIIEINTSAADGWGSSPTMGAGASSTDPMSWTGWNSDGWSAVSQFYFTIPAELKAAGVVINSAELYLETGNRNAGSSGYGGTYMQLVQYTYDGAGVSVAQAAAIDTPANYTKIGAPVFKPSLTGSSPLSEFGRTWDVKSQLAADIAADWTYMPLAARLTLSNGDFYIPLAIALGGYSDSLWNYDGANTGDRFMPHITVEYTVFEQASIGSLWGVNSDTIDFSSEPEALGHNIINGHNATGTGNVDALEFVADMQSVKTIAALGIQNRAVLSYLNPCATKIYVAVDESAVGFDPHDANSFTQQINVFEPYEVYFEPGIATADIIRWINVESVSRRYVKFEITRMDMGPVSTYPLAQWQDVLVSSDSQSRLSAGAIKALGDDEVAFDSTSMIIFDNDGSEGSRTADAVIDTAVVQDIIKLRSINYKDENTLENIKDIKVFVTPFSGVNSETDPNFDPLDKNNYSVEIFSGTFTPNSYLKGVERLADVVDVSRRYLMISVSSNYWGNFGETIPGPGYNYYARVADIQVVSTASITSCSDVIELGLALEGDMNGDCKIDMADTKVVADDWLKCTTPGGIDCVEYENYPTFQIPHGSGITINGNLSDWPSDSEWIWLDNVYDGALPFDISDARMSLRWGDDNRIYVAVVVTDSNHTFIDVPGVTYADSDRIEIYSQGDAAGGTGWGAAGTMYFDVAQHYMLGLKTLSTGGHWALWGDLTNVDPTAMESAVVVNGNQIIYEVAVKQYNNYGSRSGGATVVTPLAVGTTVGFDVILGTMYNNTAYGVLAENDFTGKYNDADQFRLYDLVQTVRAKTCGEWGYLPADLSQNCSVNLVDFARMAERWLTCNDPTDEAHCTKNW